MKTRKERSDKGQKRAKYNLSVRIERKRNRDLRNNAELVSRLESQLSKEPSVPRKMRRRLERLQKLPANRICERCGKLWLKSAQWVIQKNNIPICKRCYQSEKEIENGNKGNP